MATIILFVSVMLATGILISFIDKVKDPVAGNHGYVSRKEYFFHSRSWIQKAVDQRHPRSLEILEHKSALKLLAGRHGGAINAERKRLKRGLAELYRTPIKEKEIDDAAYLALIKPQLEALHALRTETDKAIEGCRLKSYENLG